MGVSSAHFYDIYVFIEVSQKIEMRTSNITYIALDHNDPSKPSHRLTNGREPSKTIESDGSKIKKNIENPLMPMVRPPKGMQW